MKTLIIYDSLYGNTEQIARAIGAAVTGDVKVVKAAEANPDEIGTFDLLIFGSPTQGGRYSKPMQEFFDVIPAGALKDKRVAAFDTRYKTKLVKLFGYAAARLADYLKAKGANLIAPAEAFFVKGQKGPLADDELERAAAWAKSIAEARK